MVKSSCYKVTLCLSGWLSGDFLSVSDSLKRRNKEMTQQNKGKMMVGRWGTSWFIKKEWVWLFGMKINSQWNAENENKIRTEKRMLRTKQEPLMFDDLSTRKWEAGGLSFNPLLGRLSVSKGKEKTGFDYSWDIPRSHWMYLFSTLVLKSCRLHLWRI